MFSQSNYKLKCKSYTSSLITQNCAHDDLNCTIIVLINNEIKRVTDFLRLKFLNTFIYMYAIWYFLQLLKYIQIKCKIILTSVKILYSGGQ